ncbi:MAG TPA: MaoC family dehydratase [Dehalococcoidia bacterium]|nr:MaoC family dehydratase [Dehalococcoidia bacterium]
MTEESVITDEMKAVIGVESEPSVYEIERSAIRRWAEAIGDPNPLYNDEEYAKSKGFRSLIAPPGFMGQYAFPVKVGGGARSFKSPFTRNLNGGSEYEFLKPIQAGDTITSTSKIADIRERKGKMGTMLIITSETTYKNQDGEVVAKARGTGISY